MINPADSNAFFTKLPLVATGATQPSGMVSIRYDVTRYRDIRNLGDQLAYRIQCTLRVIIPNTNSYLPGPQSILSFDDYPAALRCQIEASGQDNITLQDYAPKTINAAVTTSVSSGNGASISTSRQHTSGSTTSQSNTYGASASLGFFGDAPTGGVSVDYSHTWGNSQSNSVSTGQSAENNANASTGTSMTIKDWACYSSVDPLMTSPTWIWGQEYPWNVIQFSNTSNLQPQSSLIMLPGFVVPLLCDESQVLPPSELSRFGIDFTMKAQWLVDLGNNIKNTKIAFTHILNYCTASHSFVQGAQPSVSATLGSPQIFNLGPLEFDLCAYGLDPVDSGQGKGATVIGFTPGKFIIAPVAATSSAPPVNFLVTSTDNCLLVSDSSTYKNLQPTDKGAGFSVSETSLSATFTTNCALMQLTVNFKILDASGIYMLFIKHWKSSDIGVKLAITINDSVTIFRYVDATEAEGGDNNVMGIALRNLDYGSVDFHDYLQIGFNQIRIDITPLEANPPECVYNIRAISIERT